MANSEQQHSVEASSEQVRYAGILEIGMYIGLATLFVTFILYAFGIIKPYIPLDEISNYWSMSVHEYLEATHTHAGWNWAAKLGYGDYLNFAGVAILAGVTIICYLSIVPILAKQNDRVYAILAVLEALILTLAASGILAGGH